MASSLSSIRSLKAFFALLWHIGDQKQPIASSHRTQFRLVDFLSSFVFKTLLIFCVRPYTDNAAQKQMHPVSNRAVSSRAMHLSRSAWRQKRHAGHPKVKSHEK